MVVKRAMDWRGVLVLSFLFTSGFMQRGIMGAAQRSPTPRQYVTHEPTNEHQDKNDTQVQPYEGKARYNPLALENLESRHTCLHSNDDYDCVISNVFINGSYHDVHFGSTNSEWNNQKKLKFTNSAIRTLPKVLVDTFSHVELLNLELLQIEHIEQNALANGRNIKQLYLNYNNIASLAPGVLNNLKSLEKFAMDGNNLSSIPNGLFNKAKNLTVLTLANNNLQRISDDSFINNIHLQYVNVTNNQLFHFDLSSIKSLFEVDVSNNKLEKLHIPALVEQVYASSNEIQEVVGPKRNTLKLLMLSHNNLSNTAWLQPFANLEFLDLSHNKIEDVTSNDFKQLQRLVKLKLNNNRLFTFDMGKNVMKSLKTLDLSNNELVYVEHNYKQFDVLEQLYLDHNSIATLKTSSLWKLKFITLSNNDWDCAKMVDLLRSFPSNVTVDYNAETHCRYEKLPQGLCCKRVEMVYHDRLITKIAEVTSYEKVARANRRCNATSLIPTLQETSNQVTNSQNLPTSQLESELQALRAEVQHVQQDLQRREGEVTNNINKIDELTRIYRVVKKGLTQPSYTLGNVFTFLKQRDEFKVNETIARNAETQDKNVMLQNIKQDVDQYEKQLNNKNEQRKEKNQNIAELTKAIKKLESKVNSNPKAIRNGK